MVRRSRFLALLAPAPDPEAAHDFIRAVKEEHPGATHHCWAFVAGPPGSTARIGMSDDGEPHGTAGRPILNTLLHSGVGEVVAVVVREFGGVKLGKGGLGRAYAGAVARALETLPTRLQVALVSVRIQAHPGAVPRLRRVLASLGGEGGIEEIGSPQGVELRTRIPEGALDRLEREVASVTRGSGGVERMSEAAP